MPPPPQSASTSRAKGTLFLPYDPVLSISVAVPKTSLYLTIVPVLLPQPTTPAGSSARQPQCVDLVGGGGERERETVTISPPPLSRRSLKNRPPPNSTPCLPPPPPRPTCGPSLIARPLPGRSGAPTTVPIHTLLPLRETLTSWLPLGPAVFFATQHPTSPKPPSPMPRIPAGGVKLIIYKKNNNSKGKNGGLKSKMAATKDERYRERYLEIHPPPPVRKSPRVSSRRP